MNINQAKEYIKNSIHMYLKKDEYGDYKIPVVRQRPIFLLGAPGIGKTAIMEQIAQELGIALVSYSMTHHTRQSALGLPFIKHKTYGGKEYDVSEYTMSEIIASIYETMEKSGVSEGILFLDEINCVSETLAPSMLQFLQYKVFGKHSVPEGWIIVTAGNPPEYNKSVREFDVVTLDRLKVIAVEPDFETWKQYAIDKGIHNSIISFLELKKEFFYCMETTAKGRSYVTARGWEDLSDIIFMYEEDKLSVEENLIGQYLRNIKVVKEFAAYYQLYNKYKADYDIEKILEGNVSEDVVTKVKQGSFDERVTLVSMLLDNVISKMKDALLESDYMKSLLVSVKNLKTKDKIAEDIKISVEARECIISELESAGSLSVEEKMMHKKVIKFLRAIEVFEMDYVKERYNEQLDNMKKQVGDAKDILHNIFTFVAGSFEGERELLILVTELTASKIASRFIAMFGSEDYSKYSELLMITNRQDKLRETISNLELV